MNKWPGITINFGRHEMPVPEPEPAEVVGNVYPIEDTEERRPAVRRRWKPGLPLGSGHEGS